MKLAKKLLILTLMASVLTSTAAINSKKPHSEKIFLTDADTGTSEYEEHELKIVYPHSITIIIAS